MPALADHTHKSSSRAAANVRAHRQRAAVGVIIAKVPIPQYEVIEFLIASHRLTIAEALDPQRVAHACGEVLADIAAVWAKDAVSG
jgi:hypothetical protein